MTLTISDFVIGRTYHSTTHGPVKYCGTSTLLGETYMVFWQTRAGDTHYWSPDALNRHFDAVRGYQGHVPPRPVPAPAPAPDANGILPIGPHDHPEPMTMTWSETELRAIRAYAARCVGADRSRRRGPPQETGREDAERWRCLVRHARLGFDSAPSWNAVIRLPVFDSYDQSITALVDRLRSNVRANRTASGPQELA